MQVRVLSWAKQKRNLFLIFLFLFSLATAFFLPKALYKPKIFDCFLFFNEFDVLDIRLNELNDKVDKFILVESTRGFLNDKKPLYFLENKERYAKFLDKIEHVIVDEFPEFRPIEGTDYWEVENYQRNQIMRGLKNCRPNKRDIILISDADEIIRNDKIKKIAKLIDKEGIDVVFGELENYKHFINRRDPNNIKISVATSWENLSKYILAPQSFRNLSGFVKGHAFNGFEVLEAVKKYHHHKKWAFARVQDLGWHFTSLGSFSMFQQKIANYSHMGWNSEYNRNIENVKKRINELEWCEVDDQFPRYIIANKETPQVQALIDKKETTFH